METWNMGCTPQMVSRRQSVQEWDLAFARISNGPKNFLESLCDGWVVWKNLALMKACCLIMKLGAGMRWVSAGP